MNKCVFFDRDGIVNESPGPGYVERWEDFHLLPAFVEALRLVRSRGYGAIVVTNQRGVALGRMSLETVNEMHRRLREQLCKEHGLDLLDVMLCPHNRNECSCRKPQPGMLLTAAQRHDIDLGSSWMIGDSEKDVLAGQAAGCRTIRVCPDSEQTAADFKVTGMEALVPLLDKILETGQDT